MVVRRLKYDLVVCKKLTSKRSNLDSVSHPRSMVSQSQSVSALDGGGVSRVGMAHDASAPGRSRERAPAARGLRASVGHDHEAGVLRVAHADAAAVVERHPGRARGTIQQRIQDRPVRHGVGAVIHCLGFAVGRGDRARVEMVAADHDRRFQLAVGHHLVERQPQPVAVSRPTQQMRAGRP